MSLFLIEYERSAGRVLDLKEFPDTERDAAHRERLIREMTFRGNRDVEVVLLGAESREALQRTHARYFRNLSELLSDFAAAVRETAPVR